MKQLCRQLIGVQENAAHAPNLADHITAEEEEIWSLQFSRWRDPGYELRIEECEIFLRMLNCIGDSLLTDTLFLLSPAHGLAKPLQQLDWSLAVTKDVASLTKACGNGSQADFSLIALRFGASVFCIHLGSPSQPCALSPNCFSSIGEASLDAHDS